MSIVISTLFKVAPTAFILFLITAFLVALNGGDNKKLTWTASCFLWVSIVTSITGILLWIWS